MELNGTCFEFLYGIFGVSEDEKMKFDDLLVIKMSTIAMMYVSSVGVCSAVVPAPYGRYTSSYYGPTIPGRLGWMIQESFSFILPMVLLFTTECSLLWQNGKNLVALGLFLTHYFHRSFLYPLKLPKNVKPTPVLTVIFAAGFCMYNGFLQGFHLTNVAELGAFKEMTLKDYICVAFFFVGMGINIHHDNLLLKFKSSRSAQEPYAMPKGGLFNHISGANYFGEIIEWISLGLLTQCYPQTLFGLFTALFLGSRAYHHHQFYKNIFGSAYPPNRRALLPLLL